MTFFQMIKKATKNPKAYFSSQTARCSYQTLKTLEFHMSKEYENEFIVRAVLATDWKRNKMVKK